MDGINLARHHEIMVVCIKVVCAAGVQRGYVETGDARNPRIAGGDLCRSEILADDV